MLEARDMCSLAPKREGETFKTYLSVTEEQRGSTAEGFLRKRF